jgi:hypothetical protein
MNLRVTLFTKVGADLGSMTMLLAALAAVAATTLATTHIAIRVAAGRYAFAKAPAAR